jgi:ABC-type nitrate/sulfonate/bicarbonate transport system permease component
MTLYDDVPFPGVLFPTSALVVGVLAWWAVTVVFALPSFVLPSPVAVAGQLLDSPGLYLRNAGATLGKILVGGALGIGAGFTAGVLVAHVSLFRRMVLPYLVALRVLPKVALAPVFLLYFGIGFETAVLFVTLVTFFPMTVSTTAGFDQVPARQRDLLRSVDGGRIRGFLTVSLPFALPDIFAGLKQAVTLSVIGAIVAEWVVATDGLGSLILVASETVQVDTMLAALVVLVVLGLGLYGAVVGLQQRLRWTIDE